MGYSDRRARLWCGTLLFLFFAGWAIQVNYWGLWLYARGLDGTEVGLTLAAGLVGRAVSSALVYPKAMARWGTQPILRTTLALSVLLSLAFALVGGFAGLVAVSLLFGSTYPIVMPLSETMLSALVERGSATYGSLRLWGSVGFLFGVLAAAAASSSRDADAVVVPMIAICCVSLIHSLTPHPPQALPPRHSTVEEPAEQVVGDPIREPLAIASMIQGSHGAYFVYAAIILTRATDGPWGAVAVFALAVFAEILGFRLFARIRGSNGVEHLLLLGAIGSVARWGSLALWPNVWVLAATQPLHALTFGATHFAYASFVRTRTHATRWAAAHGAYGAVAMGIAVAVGSAVAGIAANAGSIGFAFAAMTVAAFVALVGAVFSLRRSRLRDFSVRDV